MPRYSWRKGKRSEGMMRLPKRYTLHYGNDRVLATAQEIGNDLWYWYGGGVNTYDQPASLTDVLRAAKTYISDAATHSDDLTQN